MLRPAALIVFARIPVPGAAKTRLEPLLGAGDAARLYEAFLRDALDQYRALGVAVRLYLAPSDVPVPPGLVPADVSLHTQHGDGLGPRMLRAFVETFAAGFERIVVIGTDHPTLPSAFVETAFEALAERFAVVIGPSRDGGYYLLGMNELYPEAFTGIQYSRDDVFAETLRRLTATNAALTVLPPWYDVDTPEDLARLARELREMAHPPPHTRRVLDALAASHAVLKK